MNSTTMEEVEQKEPSFYLFKHKDLDGLQAPLKGSQRVKFTSFHVSNGYIVLGTNAGGIHIFRRSSLRHYRFLNAKVFPQPEVSRIMDVNVTMVLFSNHENYLAAALSSGYVIVWALNFDKREASQIVKKSDEHKGSTVTCLCWHPLSTKLFIGNDKGCVTGLEVSTGKIRSIHTIIKEGPTIVQLEFSEDKLLISNLKRSLFYDTSKDELIQIGTKGRDGTYGGCFLHWPGNDIPFIYCARPGARVWQVDNLGQVLSTQQYKRLLNVPFTPILGNLSGFEKYPVEKPATYIFPKLHVLRNNFLLTWTKEILIIIDPITSNLILWNNQFDDIEDVCCRRQEIYIFHTGGQLTRYSLLPPKECAAKLFVLGQWLQCSKVLISCKSQIISITARDYVPIYVVRRLKDMLKDEPQHQEIVDELDDLEKSLEGATSEALPVTNEDQLSRSLLLDDSETYSVTSDIVSNSGSESVLNVTVDTGLEAVDESPKSEKKEKLTRLKNMFHGQLKDLSFDTVLLAGAQAAAGGLHWTGPLSFGANISATPPTSWAPKSPVYNPATSQQVESPGSEKRLEPALPGSTNGSVGSWEGGDSDLEVKKEEIPFKDKKKKKKKVHTVDLVSPLQPTDLIKMEKPRTNSREELERVVDQSSPPKAVDLGDYDNNERTGPTESSSTVLNTEETLRSRSVAAKQEVVQKARKFLKKLAPEDRDTGNESFKPHGLKGAGQKSASTCINAPLEVKSLVIMSRETRKKTRDCRILYEPNVLRSTLLEWILYLEKATAAVDRVYPKNQETREYYVTDVGKVLTPSIKSDLTRFLDSEDTLNISNLVTMCFKMNIYSALKQPSSENDVDNTVDMVTYDDILRCDACERKPKLCFLQSIIQPKVGHAQINMELRLDREKSRFLGVHFQHFDFHSLKANIIANCRDRRNLLKILLSCLDDFTERDAVDDVIDTGDTKVALQLMRDKAEHYQNRLLRHVFRLYYLVPRDVARLCAEIYPHFHPWEVVLVCLSSSANLFNSCSDFLIYFTHLLQKNSKSRKNSWDICDDIYHSKDFLMLVFHSALILDDLTDSDVRCQCGWPRRHSHKTSFQYEELMIEIADYFRNSGDEESLKELLKISWNHGYWQGCIQILVMLNLRLEALQLVLQLDDITLMSSKQMWGTLPQTSSEWQYALVFLVNLNPERSDFDRHLVEAAKTDQVVPSNVENNENTLESDVPTKTKGEEGDELRFCTTENKQQEGLTNSFENINLSEESAKESYLHSKTESNTAEPNQPSILDEVYQHSCINGASGAEGTSCFDMKSFSMLFLQKVGPKEALHIISNCHLQGVNFTREFYYKCILTSLLENQQSALCHRILRELNQYMWTSKCTAMSPQIYEMKEVEISRGNKEDIFKGKQSLRYTRTLEDGACNWGINIPLPKSKCGVCPLPLCEKLPGHNQGIVVFPCGHVHHKECNPENYCLTCFHDKLKHNLTGFASLSSAFS